MPNIFKWRTIHEHNIPFNGPIKTELPKANKIIIIKIDGLTQKDNIKIIANNAHLIFEGKGNFNNGYIFVNIDGRDFEEIKIVSTITKVIKNYKVSTFEYGDSF